MLKRASIALIGALFALSLSPSSAQAVAAPPPPQLSSIYSNTVGATAEIVLTFALGSNNLPAGFKYSSDSGSTWKECNSANCSWTSPNKFLTLNKQSSSNSSFQNGTSHNFILQTCLTGAGNLSGTGLFDCSSNSNVISYIVGTAAAPCAPNVSTSGSTQIYKFTTVGTCTFQIPAGVSSGNLLVVAGGGGGGGDAAGGGGGGGVYLNPSYSVTSGATVNVVVGAGGIAGQCSSGNASGCTSPPLTTAGHVLAGPGGPSGFNLITTPGGGAGGTYNSGAGGNGGSGGGGAASGGIGGTATATSTYFYGNNGGTSAGRGAGGGGAGTAGTSGNGGTGGNGGDGISTSISGTFTYYGGGGGGGGDGNRGTGGQGGGGSGALSCAYPLADGTDSRQAQVGIANTGGGGGGAPYGCAGTGAAGGSGVVIFAFMMIPDINSVVLAAGGNQVKYRTNAVINANLSSDGRVKFFLNGKAIPGCINVSSISSVASCTWKPSIHGYGLITAKVIGGTTSAQFTVGVAKRTSIR